MLRVDRRRQVRHRDLDLELVAAAGVGVVRRRLVVADPRGARRDLHAGRVRRVGDRVGQRTGRVALVVVGVARPARPVRAVAVRRAGVVRVGEDAELERRRGVHVRLRGVAARVDQELDGVRLPVPDALGGGDGIALVVVDDVDEEVQVVARARDLGVVAAVLAAVGGRAAAARALPYAAEVERRPAVFARALGAVDVGGRAGLRDRRRAGRSRWRGSPSRCPRARCSSSRSECSPRGSAAASCPCSSARTRPWHHRPGRAARRAWMSRRPRSWAAASG